MSNAITTDLLIAGELTAGHGAPREVRNPATEEVVAVVHDGSTDDLERALAAADRAWGPWAATPPGERAAILRRIADLLDEHAEELAQLLVAEVGKPISEARGETGATSGYFRYTASLLETLTDEMGYTPNRGESLWVRRRPHGVVGAIIPWNYPSALTSRKIAPAIAAGNAIVVKPDEKTPLSALAVARIIHESGLLPDGLVNVVTGPGEVIGSALVTSRTTQMISMTGSTFAGKAILAAAASQVKPVSLELGGNAPLIVMPDADLDHAVAETVASRHANNGQVCICAERIYVHRDVYDDFVQRYVAAVGELVVGDPLSESTQLGPKVSRAELEKTQALVEESVAQGARVVLGADLPDAEAFRAGYWMNPVVLADVTDEMAVFTHEVFGPVSPISSFDTWDEVVARANDTNYGLSAYVFTSSLDTAFRASDDLSFGEVYVNRTGPEEMNGFHIGFRESGLGGDDGPHGFDQFFRRQTTYVRHTSQRP
ncbi:aldehyde dehydrogenase family protein [Microbacterium sp. KSW2-29]|uniref:Aldehyde dehydrogenase family protein n=1 Tax=Microbacterium phycohabitans TaxID=3075993 RepID=A0ABU3SLL4_9MICO|nr:aldehyde dehydrogenase family protein [Microbacterium sp. KSW2-29]MDU0345683.1 aldehyde dehydrogenase family protein [Microbacterium sp. KSW2-29]